MVDKTDFIIQRIDHKIETVQPLPYISYSVGTLLVMLTIILVIPQFSVIMKGIYTVIILVAVLLLPYVITPAFKSRIRTL